MDTGLKRKHVMFDEDTVAGPSSGAEAAALPGGFDGIHPDRIRQLGGVGPSGSVAPVAKKPKTPKVSDCYALGVQS